MQNNKAAYLEAPSAPLVVKDAPPPTLRPHDLLVRNQALAINPLDVAQQYKGVLVNAYPHIGGCDIAGIVEDVGPDVPPMFKKGDRVVAIAPALRTGDLGHAAFQLYTAAPHPMVAHIPDGISFASAVVFPLALATAANGLFEPVFLGIESPNAGSEPTDSNKEKVVLVWGGSGSVGSCAIQLLAAAGITVLATASPHNFDYVKELGAHQVFDRKDPDVVTKLISAAQGKTVIGAYNAVAGKDVTLACANFLHAFNGGKVYCVYPDDKHTEVPDGVLPIEGFAPTLKEDGTFTTWAVVWSDFMRVGLANGKLKPRPHPMVVEGGLGGLNEGIKILSQGVSAKKVVVTL